MNRLETLAPGLASKLRHASTAQQRAACLAACEFAISQAKIENTVIERAIKEIGARGVLGCETKKELDSLAAQMDDKYLDLQSAVEEGRASKDDYMLAFRQARAAAALSFAGGDDALSAATEATYEAAATTDDKGVLTALIEGVLEP